MQLYKRNGVYQVTYQSGDGKQVRRSLKTRNKRLADKLIAKLCLDLYESTLLNKEPPRGFLELMMHYLEAKQQASSFTRLQDSTRRLVAYFGDADVCAMKPVDIERYITHRLRTISDGTVLREVGVLSAAFNHAIKKHQWHLVNPCTNAGKPKRPKGRVRWITKVEAERLIQVAGSPVSAVGANLSSQYHSPILRNFIELSLNTGCRKGEVLRLKWENIDFTNRLAYLSETKSGEWQTVPLNDDARRVLVSQMRLRDTLCPNTPWVFFHTTAAMNTKVGGRVKDVRTSFATACKRAGITNFHPHDLRHTFASWLVMDGVPLYDVSKVMRHASIEMTQRYAHLAPDHLHSTVSRIKTSAQFQHTGDLRQLVVVQNGLNKGINGRGERI